MEGAGSSCGIGPIAEILLCRLCDKLRRPLNYLIVSSLCGPINKAYFHFDSLYGDAAADDDP